MCVWILLIFAFFCANQDGDDLRSDVLTLQMFRIMDKMWKSHGECVCVCVCVCFFLCARLFDSVL